MKILVIQQKMIGDVLLSSLICKNLKTWNPESNIDFVANQHTLDVLQNNPYIDNIIVFKDTFKKNKWGLIKFLWHFRKKRYDYIIDAYGKLESLLITKFTPAKTKIGYQKFYTNWIYNRPIERLKISDEKLQLSILHRLQLLKPIMGNVQMSKDFEIHLTDAEKGKVKKEFDHTIGKGESPIMIAAIGSSAFKTYPLNYMARLIDLTYATTSAPLILNYMPNQKAKIDELVKMLQPKTKRAILESLTPNSLRDYMATAYHCQAVIGNEGGAINIAKGLSKPTFAIFSPFINPSGWHTEVKNKCMAVHIQDFFPMGISSKNGTKLKKKPKVAEELYHKLRPELFEKKWINFLENLNK